MLLQKFKGGGARRMIKLYFKIRGGQCPPSPTSSGPHVYAYRYVLMLYTALPHVLQRLRQRSLHVLVSCGRDCFLTRLKRTPNPHSSYLHLSNASYEMNIIRSFWDSASVCIIGVRWYKLEGHYCRFYKNPGYQWPSKTGRRGGRASRAHNTGRLHRRLYHWGFLRLKPQEFLSRKYSTKA